MPLAFIPLLDRAIIRFSGADVRSFLQGIVSNDVAHLTPHRAILAALLSPQGKLQCDFFLLEDEGGLLLETESKVVESLLKKLTLYRLRSDVKIEQQPVLSVAAFPGEGAAQAFGLPAVAGAARRDSGVALFVDPRWPAMGVRAVGPVSELKALAEKAGAREASPETYEETRLAFGIPEGTKDAVIDRTLLLENGYDKLGGVDFAKGCYVGQEVTARSKHRGELRKYLMQVHGEAPLPPYGTPLTAHGKTLGEMRSSSGATGLALVRIDAWQEAGPPVLAGDVPITLRRPVWWDEKPL